MKQADFTGVLRGEALAEAYANLDVFVFPSETDTYGNVVLEAQASGVPAIVTARGGPRFIVRANESGFIARSCEQFASGIVRLHKHHGELSAMRAAARAESFSSSWDQVFHEVYRGYERGFSAAAAAGKKIRNRSTSPVMSGTA